METSMDGSDPATWDPKLDAVLAAPENHTVLYEDDSDPRARREHRTGRHREAPSPSLPVGLCHRSHGEAAHSGATSEEIPLPVPKDVAFPITLKFLPQPLHYVENLDTRPFHATRVEFKNGFPTGM